MNLLKNFYFFVTCLFISWMLLFDSNDFIDQIKMSKRLRELESEANYYQEKIQEVEKERTALFTDPHELEKFARETYLMKKRSEDVYVISKD